MTPFAKSWLRHGLRVLGGLLIAGAALLGFFSIRVMVEGIHPPDGNGSLGHVGMVFAGIIGCFITLTSVLIGVWMFQQARRFSGETSLQLIGDEPSPPVN